MSKPANKKIIYKVMKRIYDILNSNTFETTGKRRWNDSLDIEDMEWKIIHIPPFYNNKKL